MPSIVQGFEYDIFISYRQKDNQYDGWVTEFVSNLQKELDATFKEEISIYFDENPHDGLLETHNVNKSLEGKLKCLVFVPIISQTYCDPKSFAWQNEFLAFIDLVASDKFGQSVQLKDGNVADRILPVQIHDIDEEDKILYQQASGSVLRSVPFIYNIPGVNRQLRAIDDQQIKSPDQILYRDQINKVSRAIKEIITAIKATNTEAISEKKPGAVLKNVTSEKVVIEPPLEPTGQSIKQKSSSRVSPRYFLYLFAAILIVVSGYFAYQWLDHRSKVTWAKEEVLPQIKKAIDEENITWEVLSLIEQALQYIPDDPNLKTYIKQATFPLDFNSEPPGAKVYGKDYFDSSEDWKVLGTTPLKEIRIPRTKATKFKFERAGYAVAEQPLDHILLYFGLSEISVQLQPLEETPQGMVYIEGDTSQMRLVGFDHLPKKVIDDFWIDKFEVTNKDFKEFMNAGGYKNPKYWQHKIFNGEKEISLVDATKLFKDKTGVTGPAFWEAGSYPDGQENYPVGGISWYEAAAYAEFVGKELPTIYHWNYVANIYSSGIVVPMSNMKGNKAMEVGKSGSMNSGGTFDLAGNVREWTYNKESKTGERFILGGGWDDAPYAFTDAYSLPTLSRSATNGFRCMLLTDTMADNSLTADLENPTRDFSEEKPIEEDEFNLLVRQYAYDKTDLEPELISVDSANEYWVKQKVEINAAYNNERIPVYLYLPKHVEPPFQAVVMFPGDGGFYNSSSENMGVPDYIPKSGRALVVPVYKSIYERRDELESSIPTMTNQYKEHVIMWSKDIRRAVDYLEKRDDIDSDKLAYFGHSWGGRLGPVMMYTEKRFKTGILTVAGLRSQRCQPEADPFNFVPRVKIPVLMLNGEYDFYFPVESSQKPMFELWGTPNEDKMWKLYDRSHQVPRTELAKESIAWLNKYLGPEQ